MTVLSLSVTNGVTITDSKRDAYWGAEMLGTTGATYPILRKYAKTTDPRAQAIRNHLIEIIRKRDQIARKAWVYVDEHTYYAKSDEDAYADWEGEFADELIDAFQSSS